jgi:flagellar motor protein MotB
MKKFLMSFVAFSAFALLGSGCVSLEEFDRVQRAYETEMEANTAMSAENARLGSEVNRLRAEHQKNLAQIKAMQDASANQATISDDELMDRFKEIWGNDMNGWETVRSGGAMGVRMDDSGVLFKSGSWDLTENTKTKLAELAEIICKKMSTDAGVLMRVDGHTDNDPVKKLKAKGINDNMHLSTMRAMAVKDFLVSKGVPQDRIFVAGFGEFWPLNTGNAAKDKQRNRRVEVYLGDADALSIGALPGASVSK